MGLGRLQSRGYDIVCFRERFGDSGGLNLVVTAVLLGSLGAWLWWYRWSQRNNLGPKVWPVAGCLPDLQTNWLRLHDYMTGFMYKIHTIKVHVGFGFHAVVTADSANIKYIMKSTSTITPSYETASTCSHSRFSHPLWKVERFFRLGQERDLKKTMADLDSFAYDVIQRRKTELPEGKLMEQVNENCKEAVANDVLRDGTKVMKGDAVLLSAYGMGRMPYVWGPDAGDFKPERWIKDGEFQPESPFKYIAFHGSPRLCLGKDSSYLQMKITVALLTQFFDFQLVPGHPYHYKTIISLIFADGLPVTIHKRGSTQLLRL